MVLVTDVQGSAPRPMGTRMVISATEIYDTIGGGALELSAINHARELLSRSQVPVVSCHEFALGKALSQCCGGRVTLQFEYHPAQDFRVHVFGAGHVALELVRILGRLPCRATFHDERAEWLEKVELYAEQTVNNVEKDTVLFDQLPSFDKINTRLLAGNPHAVVEACETDAYFIIMTHSHELDLELVEAVLTRGDSRYCGLIASRSKASSFTGRLSRKGFTENELQQLTAPLGKCLSTGNTPMEVAVAAVADLLTTRQQSLQEAPHR